MPYRVKDLAENLCLHDAELLSFQEDIPELPIPPLIPIPIAIISLRQNDKSINLVYLLWGEVTQARPLDEWPFSLLRTHWLYDEIDLERRQPELYWHRIMWSDGRVVAIPFFDVIVQVFSSQNPETAIISRKRA